MATVNPAGPASVLALAARFAENGAGTYVADFPLPADATIVDIIVEAEALWTAGTSAALIVGDSGDPDGYLASIDLKATDLLLGECISIGSTQVLGGKTGAYIGVGTNTHVTKRTSTAARTITASVTSVGAGTAGRTRVTVLYTVGTPTVVTQ